MEKGKTNYGYLATIQRYVKTVDNLTKSLEHERNVFTNLQVSTAHSKLKEVISTSLLEHFKSYGGGEEYELKVTIKLEDLLWKKVFYNPINLFKNSSKCTWHADEIDSLKKHIEGGIKFYKFMLKEYCSNVKTDEGLTNMSNLRRSVVYCITCLADLSRYFALDLNKKYDVEMPLDVLPISYYQQILQFKPSSELTLMNLGTVYQDWLGEPLKALLLYVTAIPSEKASFYANKKLNDLLKSANSSFDMKESCSEESFISCILNAVHCLHSKTISSDYVSEVCVKLLRDFNYLLSGDDLSEETLLLSFAVLAQSYDDVIIEQRKPIFARLMASLLIASTSSYCKRVKNLITKELSDDFYDTYMKGIRKSVPEKATVANSAEEMVDENKVQETVSDDENESFEKEKWLKNRRRRKIASILPEDSDDDSTVSDSESTSSLSDSESDLSDDDDTLSECGSQTPDVILESGSDQEDEVLEVPEKEEVRVLSLISECESLDALLPSICILTKWICETTLSKNSFPWVNDANMTEFYKVLQHLSVITCNILEETEISTSSGLSNFLKLVDENSTTFSDYVLQNDFFKLPKVADFPLLLGLHSTDSKSVSSHPEIVCANMKDLLSCLVEVETVENHILSRSDQLLLHCLRYKSYLHKLSQFEDCPLSYDMSAGTFTVTNVTEDVKPKDSSEEEEENVPSNEKEETGLRDFNGEEKVRGIVRCKLPSTEMRHIVVDVTALSRNTPFVKRLVSRTTGNTVYIAQQVLKELDEEKYRSIDSRRVSKWLQKLLSSWKCPSTLKLEAKDQRKKLNVVDYPIRQQRITWDWFQTLEFVFWLTTAVTSGVVILLTGHTKRKVQELPLPLEECVKAAGAELHYISDFQLNASYLTNG